MSYNAVLAANLLNKSYIERQQIVFVSGDKTLYLKNKDILEVPWDVAEYLKLPPGHPRHNLVYIGHPGIKSLYYPAAHFHRRTFEHKFVEAIKFLMALGVTQIKVICVDGWSYEFAAKLDIPAIVDFHINADTDSSQKSNYHVLFEATLNGAKEPTLPENLVWYQNEPAWQQIAEGRLKYGLKNFSLSIRYEDDFGINGNFKTKVIGFGFDFGGNFEEHRSTLWHIIGEFKEVY